MYSKVQIIPIKKLNIKTCFIQFLWFFRLKSWVKGQIISRIHLSLPNACTLMCFNRNINGNSDVKFLIGIIGHYTDGRKLLYYYYCPLPLQVFFTFHQAWIEKKVCLILSSYSENHIHNNFGNSHAENFNLKQILAKFMLISKIYQVKSNLWRWKSCVN